MEDTWRIKAALEFLKDNKGFTIGKIFLNHKNNEIFVNGYTNFSSTDFMNKRIALEELQAVKQTFNDYKLALKEFADFVADKKIRYTLNLNYGMGHIGICDEVNGEIIWIEKLAD